MKWNESNGNLFRFLRGVLPATALVCRCAVEGAPLPPVPPGQAVGIAVSRNMPLVGETVTVQRLAPAVSTCDITGPHGETRTLHLDAAGQAIWRPAHYGPHQLRCGDRTRRVWVLARRMWFDWWDGRNFPENATIVMSIRKGSDAEWRHRGVSLVGWVVGEYAHRANSGYKPPYARPEQWVTDWLTAKGKSKEQSGFALDEVYCGNKAPSPAIATAVAEFRRRVGPDYLLTIYTSGAEPGFDKWAKLLRESQALCMTESYYGDEELFRKRWNDMKQYGLEHQTLFAIGPGFKLRPDCHGPLTPAAVRAEFAKVRRVAPESPGIAIYNAFSKEDAQTLQPTLDEACSQAVEDFYLKPVLHISVSRHGRSRVVTLWNIGNDDARGLDVEWLNAQGDRTGQMAVSALRPQERKRLVAPPNAISIKLREPAGIVNLYPGGMDLPP